MKFWRQLAVILSMTAFHGFVSSAGMQAFYLLKI